MAKRKAPPPVAAPIESINLGSAAEERYLNYALSVITARALPDVRDGLKPVQRRILYAMFQSLRLTAGAKPRKSAAVVGDVLGKYHPHGDLAAYEAMVRMAQPFALRYPLVHGEGNFGSLDGDSPAAMRYTETRLTALAEELLRDVRHDTVDFRDNYDATLQEPEVLPAALPQLLMNGSTGIAVGMATNVPPHNLNEIIDALIALLSNAKLQTKDLCKHIRGPDFPTAGEILNSKKELREIYESGHGPVRIRAQYTTEKSGRRSHVIVTSIPYATNKATIVEEIAQHITSRKLPQAIDVRDESTDIIRIVVEIKNDTSAEAVMAYLFKHTHLQINFNVNLTALTPGEDGDACQPARLNLRDICQHFLDFRLQVVTRRLNYELRELQARLHILAGFVKIFRALDKAIKIIRESSSRDEACKRLMKTFSLDEAQANAILETRLYQLARLEIDKIRKEQAEKKKRADEIEKTLRSKASLRKLIAAELRQVADKYGDKRRTVLRAGAELVYDAEAYIVHEDTNIVVTRDGWLKRVGELRDKKATRVREGDVAKWILRGTTRDSVALWSSRGIVYVLKVSSIQATSGYGEPVQSLCKFADGETIIHAVLVVPANGTADQSDGPEQRDLFAGSSEDQAGAALILEAGQDQARTVERWLVASRGGMGFFCRPDLSDTTRSGRRFARTKDGDEIACVSAAEGDTITAATATGKVLSFDAEELAELAGAGRGVILMRLDDKDQLVGARCHPGDSPPLAVDADGNERRFQRPEIAKRAQKGRKVLKRFKAVDLVPRS